MAYPVLAVANRILELAQAEGKRVDPLKLQKLVYLSHGWSLAFTGEPLVREGFDAWQYGPVCPPLYQAFKQFRANNITSGYPVEHANFTPSEERLLEEIVRVYGNKSGMELSSLTHEPDSAWRATYDGSVSSSPPIPNYLIKAEFEKRRQNG